MNTTRSRVATLLAVVAALALLAAAPMAVSAATTTLAGDGSDTVTGFTASPDDHLEYSFSSSGTDFGTDGTSEVYLNVSYNGIEHAEASSDVASGDASYLFNVSHSALSTLPGSPGETVTVNVTAYGTDGSGTTTTGPTTFAVDITFADTYGNIFLAEGSTDYDNAEITEGELGTFASLTNSIPGFEDDNATDNVEIERTETLADGDEVNIDFAAEDTTSAFSDTVGGFDSAGDPVLGMTVTADDSYVPVFNSNAPDWFDENSTHAIYDSSSDELTFNAGSDFGSSGQQTDLYVVSADPFADGDSSNNDTFDLSVKSGGVRVNLNSFSTNINGGNLTSDTWSMVTFTYDDNLGQSNLYFDGSEVTSGGTSGALNSTPATFKFGGRGDRSFIDGILDDARFYSKALSETEVSNLYDTGSING